MQYDAISLEINEIQWAIQRNVTFTFECQVWINMNHQHRIMQKEQNQQNQPLISPISSISKISIISTINFKEARWMESFNCKRLDFLKYTKQLSKIWKQVSTCLNIIRIIIRIICLRVSLHVSGPVASVVSHGRANLQGVTHLRIPTDSKCF